MLNRRKTSRNRTFVVGKRGPQLSFIAIRNEIREVSRMERMIVDREAPQSELKAGRARHSKVVFIRRGPAYLKSL